MSQEVSTTFLLSLWDSEHPRKSMNKILEHNPNVIVFHNNETGKWLWSIVLEGTDLWLTSFSNQKKAEDFVKKHKLNYTLSGYIEL